MTPTPVTASGAPLRHEAVPVPLDLSPDARYLRRAGYRDAAGAARTHKVGPYRVLATACHLKTHQQLIVLTPVPCGTLPAVQTVACAFGDFLNLFEKVEGPVAEPAGGGT